VICWSGFLCSVPGTRSAAASVALQDGVLLTVRTVFVVNSAATRTLTDGIDSKLAGAVKTPHRQLGGHFYWPRDDQSRLRS
jgi:hypothetical protein